MQAGRTHLMTAMLTGAVVLAWWTSWVAISTIVERSKCDLCKYSYCKPCECSSYYCPSNKVLQRAVKAQFEGPVPDRAR